MGMNYYTKDEWKQIGRDNHLENQLSIVINKLEKIPFTGEKSKKIKNLEEAKKILDAAILNYTR